MIRPEEAHVRPRVRVADGVETEPVLLEEWIRGQIEAHHWGPFHLNGPSGSGKSTAMRHLAARFRECRELVLVDERDSPPTYVHYGDRLVLFAVHDEASLDSPPVPGDLELVPWSQDDLIELLLATCRDDMASILARIHPRHDELRFGGRPWLWAELVELMVAEPGLPDEEAALERLIDTHIPMEEILLLGPMEEILLLCTAQLHGTSLERDLRSGWPRLHRFLEVGRILGWRAMLQDLELGRDPDWLRSIQPHLVRDAPRHLVPGGKAWSTLTDKFVTGLKGSGGAASLINAVDHRALCGLLEPMQGEFRFHEQAYLVGLDLTGLGEDLVLLADGASLWTAKLARTHFESAAGAQLQRADLRGALLDGANFAEADLSAAILSDVRAHDANFERAELVRADLTAGFFGGAVFRGANLQGARLEDADLSYAVFSGANLDLADLDGAGLRSASLDGVDLRTCLGQPDTFEGAWLPRANLEGLHFEAPEFADAHLDGALLTDTSFPGADMRGASLVGCGLGGVSWKGADLREADLTNASFHFGSSRSGLIFAGPMEGSRTGFYDQESKDLLHKDPADVRKADLRGANLLGAWVKDTDFYLVDLRGAIYDARQGKHFANCGAILK